MNLEVAPFSVSKLIDEGDPTEPGGHIISAGSSYHADTPIFRTAGNVTDQDFGEVLTITVAVTMQYDAKMSLFPYPRRGKIAWPDILPLQLPTRLFP
jgi:hypothetical protein